MSDPIKQPDETQKKLSRRNLIRNSAITAAGAVILPSFLAGCRKEFWHMFPGGGNNPGPGNGWIGGFAQSNPAFAYPNPDLSSLPMLKNMDNIGSLDRQQAAIWPEFSWESEPGTIDPERCFQMFAPDISRVGYTDTGRIYSIICPQQGVCSDTYGCMNVEVTVTGQRGWVDESTRLLAADMTVEGRIWFSPSGLQTQEVQLLFEAFTTANLPFPSTKKNAIRVSTHLPGDPNQPIFPLRSGQTGRFTSPAFSIHREAWSVANIDVEIGPIIPIGNSRVDAFNQLVLDFFNLGAGKLLELGNVLSWNVWLTAPTVVDQVEWTTHAERWRDSIDVEHEHGPGTIARYDDGRAFEPGAAFIAEKIEEILAWVAANI